MKNLIKIVPLVAALSLVACKKDQSADQLVVNEETTVTAPDSTAAATATAAPTSDATLVTANDQAKEASSKPLTSVALSESSFEFGKIKKGDHKEHTYEITNTGKNPLIISQVKPGCGCTVPDYTKDPIMPGKKGKITLKFDSSNFDGLVQKQAEVFANVEKSPMVITFSADIQPK
ncbi:DUF1573 domain-containing protein [Kaistella sp. G5-32]|uniref:DUF1573 domain-containing protein n=1 Tax=Kaistella gelatinilytica TaxID=2787636 RepID=A0ABS0FCM1_9FLAO|nr:DUF1573 domain-containing protein [Kaistella gelatinilytica]MBF8457468.1 DUF1573 domain-containing protein [Kaistella gelatinilytica]